MSRGLKDSVAKMAMSLETEEVRRIVEGHAAMRGESMSAILRRWLASGTEDQRGEVAKRIRERHESMFSYGMGASHPVKGEKT